MSKLVLFISALAVVSFEVNASSLALSGFVAHTMAAEMWVNYATQRLRIRNAGNESFKIIIADTSLPVHLQEVLASTVPAQMQSDISLKIGTDLDSKISYHVSIQAP